jgi:hypothetical protein
MGEQTLPAAWGIAMTEPNIRHPRLRLLTYLMIGISLVGLVWVVETRQWIQNRHDAEEWLSHQRGCGYGERSNRSRLPWSLWLLGEDVCMEFVIVHSDEISTKDVSRIEQLKQLFPEAEVTIKTNAEWEEIERNRPSLFPLPDSRTTCLKSTGCTFAA